MCGIAGVVCKNGMDISKTLIDMLSLIQHRGEDASGIAVFGETYNVVMIAAINDKSYKVPLIEIIEEHCEIVKMGKDKVSDNAIFIEFDLDIHESKIKRLHNEINRASGMAIHSISKNMRVYKDNGLVEKLEHIHKVNHDVATHGIGHVRMATESAEDVNAAHPFVSPFFSELAIVHNGQLTNYYKIRRLLESKGAIFKTTNDSEAASHLISYYMRQNGGDLDESLHKAYDTMDGIYSIIAATKTQIGIAKDRLGLKPLLYLETADMLMLASEQIEITPLFPDAYAEEMEPGEVRIWNI